MWKLLRAEIGYGKILLMGFVGVFVFLGIYEVERVQAAKTFLPAICAVLAVNMVVASRVQENREHMLAQLPVSVGQLGLVRLLSIAVPAVALLGLRDLIHLALVQNLSAGVFTGPAAFPAVLAWVGLILIVMDLASPNLKPLLQGGMVLGLLLMFTFTGLFVFVTKSQGGSTPTVVTAIRFIEAANPFAGEWGTLRLLAFAVVVAGLSVVTYGRRKSYSRSH